MQIIINDRLNKWLNRPIVRAVAKASPSVHGQQRFDGLNSSGVTNMQQSAVARRVMAFLTAAFLIASASSNASAQQEESSAATSTLVVVASFSEQLYAQAYQAVRKASHEAAAHLLSKTELMNSLSWIEPVKPVSEAIVLTEPFSAKPVGVSE